MAIVKREPLRDPLTDFVNLLQGDETVKLTLDDLVSYCADLAPADIEEKDRFAATALSTIIERRIIRLFNAKP